MKKVRLNEACNVLNTYLLCACCLRGRIKCIETPFEEKLVHFTFLLQNIQFYFHVARLLSFLVRIIIFCVCVQEKISIESYFTDFNYFTDNSLTSVSKTKRLFSNNLFANYVSAFIQRFSGKKNKSFKGNKVFSFSGVKSRKFSLPSSNEFSFWLEFLVELKQ